MTSSQRKRPPTSAAPALYGLHITLAAGVIKPPIWRLLVVDGRISLGTLHHYIQAAFGWTDAHQHEFYIDNVITAFRSRSTIKAMNTMAWMSENPS